MIKHFYFKQFNLASIICLHLVYMWNSSILPINRTLQGATNPGQSEPVRNGNEVVVSILQSSSMHMCICVWVWVCIGIDVYIDIQ